MSTETLSATDFPHRRYNSLTGDWILVSPHRTKRPWLGKVETLPRSDRPAHDPKCLLCAGNVRMNGERNPDYKGTFVFTNDFSAVLPEPGQLPPETSPLLHSEPAAGVCHVICFSPNHGWTLPEMPVEAIIGVVNTWADEITELGKKYRWVQIFENKGDVMGCSNPHPHGQVWATNFVPNEPTKEDNRQREYFAKHNTPLLLDYLQIETASKSRVVIENDDWVVLVPYWATWPYETLLLPRRHIQRLPELTDSERKSLAEILKRHLTRYDNLFEVSFPYSMGWHGAPTDGQSHPHWQLHAHFYPPLLRSATVKKFMVGYEMMAEGQRDLTAEQAADKLRGLSEVHFKSR
jgi:UDPglucose--hexose-1-phosphate uridylyltransferase